MNVLRGETLGTGRRVAIVASRFNELVTSKLVEGACAGLSHHGVVAEDGFELVFVRCLRGE